MTNGSPTSTDREALLRRIALLRVHISMSTLLALTGGREPHELPDDELRYVITAIESALPQ